MANTYTQISVHTVFAVKGRANIITKEWRDDLHRYISGIVTGEGAKLLAVGGWKDHVHVFMGLQPVLSIAEILQKIKANSSRWINEQHFVKGKFQWQRGYGAFSYARSQRDPVIKYIMNQEEHHRNQTFREEFIGMLINFEVEYDEKFLFEFYD
jgi:REP element-mobilizing transposase RayT